MGLLKILDTLGARKANPSGGGGDESRRAAEEHIAQGVELALREQLSDALAEFKKAASRCPEMAEAHLNVGLACARLQRPADAATAFTRALSIDPDYVEAHYNLGLAYVAMGRHVDAIGAYHRARVAARKAGRDCVEALHSLGEVYEKFGDDKLAFKAWHSAVEAKPDYVPVYGSLVGLHVIRKEKQIALQLCEQLMHIDASEAGRLHDYVVSTLRAESR